MPPKEDISEKCKILGRDIEFPVNDPSANPAYPYMTAPARYIENGKVTWEYVNHVPPPPAKPLISAAERQAFLSTTTKKFNRYVNNPVLVEKEQARSKSRSKALAVATAERLAGDELTKALAKERNKAYVDKNKKGMGGTGAVLTLPVVEGVEESAKKRKRGLAEGNKIAAKTEKGKGKAVQRSARYHSEDDGFIDDGDVDEDEDDDQNYLA